MARRYQGLKPQLSAAEINRWNEAADRNEFRSGLSDFALPEDQQSHWVWIRNDSGNDRERFEILSLGDPIFDLADDGTADLLFVGETAAEDKTPAILLEPIADGEFGRAVIHGMAVAWVAGGASIRSASVDVTTHRLKPGGVVQLLTLPGAATEKLLPVMLGLPANGIAVAPAGGIPGRTGTGPYTWGSASCTLVSEDGNTTAATLQIYNMVSADIEPGLVQWKTIGNLPFVDVEECT